MKIIAHTQSNGRSVLVEMSDQELAHLAGHSYASNLASHNGIYRNGLEVGTEYKLSEAWNRIVHQAGSAGQIETISRTLSALNDLVTQTKAQLVVATKQPTP